MSVLTTRMTAAEFSKMGHKSLNKYRAQRVEVDGQKFDSKGEYGRWCELKLLQRTGDIANLQRQVPFLLSVNGVYITKYIADFTYFDMSFSEEIKACVSSYIVEDFKSKATITTSYRYKKKLMLAIHGIDIRETFARAA